jgi:pimeloyl-ACP methyl ester carboxylesterase
MQKTDLRFTLPDGITICADGWGDAANKTVLLAHGGGQTRHSWGGTAAALAQRGWYAIAYDHRGHGDSDWSRDGNYALDQFARDLDFIARSFSQPPAVVGASLGGLSAMVAQGRSSTAVFSALVLVDVTPRMNPAGALNIIEFMRADSEHGFASLEQAAAAIARYTRRPPRKDLSGLAKNLRRGADNRYRWHWDPAFIADQEHKIGTTEQLEHMVSQIRQPILLARGRMSDLVTEELAQQFLELVPHARYADIEHARHMVAGDRNDLFTDAVVDFLQSL